MYNQADNDSEPENENYLNDKHMADYEMDNTQQGSDENVAQPDNGDENNGSKRQ